MTNNPTHGGPPVTAPESVSESPDWLKVGADVAEVVKSARNGSSVKFAKVTKIGKRDVVLDNGNRFNVARLFRNEGSTWSGCRIDLVAADDPVVDAIRRQIRVSNARSEAREMCDAVEKALRDDKPVEAAERAEALAEAVKVYAAAAEATR